MHVALAWNEGQGEGVGVGCAESQCLHCALITPLRGHGRQWPCPGGAAAQGGHWQANFQGYLMLRTPANEMLTENLLQAPMKQRAFGASGSFIF